MATNQKPSMCILLNVQESSLILIQYYEFGMHCIGYYLLHIQYRCHIYLSLAYKVLDQMH